MRTVTKSVEAVVVAEAMAVSPAMVMVALKRLGEEDTLWWRSASHGKCMCRSFGITSV